MKNFIFGFVIGSVLSGSFVFAALPDGIMAREYNKFVQSSSGNTAVRVVAVP
jgi:hypothetical protein